MNDAELDAIFMAMHREKAAVEQKILLTLEEYCPAGEDHFPVQHRDGKSPWCRHCGRTKNGLRVGTPRDAATG